MPAGCKNPNAVNFNPLANPDNFSCVYLFKNQSNCHWFEDINIVSDNSFTLSYSIKGNSWVFFHDYFPDMYIHTREQLYTAKDSSLFKHNSGPAGFFHQPGTDPKKPFFIDAVFQADTDLILETVNWMTDFLDTTITDQPFQTLTHISIWNSHQHTGRINLSKLQQFKELTARNTKGVWNFDDFRNILKAKGVTFLDTIFKDYAVLSGQTDSNLPWYAKELLIDKWFCVRFEFDNSSDVQLVLHDTTIQAIKSSR